MNKIMIAMAASAMAVPGAAYAAPQFHSGSPTAYTSDVSNFQDRRERAYNRGYRQGRRDESVGRDTRVWRGDDGRTYCRRKNGTTGLIIGAGVGALAGREIAGRGDRTIGAILGAAGGGLLGREIDKGRVRCR